jgi:hypothetical protein
MAKTIHWPLPFEQEVLNEDCEAWYCAIRPGRLYFDNQYWAPQEVVDIRVNHQIVRKGMVTQPLELFTFGELPAVVYQRLKPTLASPDMLKSFLESTYNRTIEAQDYVTVVTYQNLPITPLLG